MVNQLCLYVVLGLASSSTNDFSFPSSSTLSILREDLCEDRYLVNQMAS